MTYRSPIQKASATGAIPARFSTMRVGVAVPANVEDQSHVWYRVKLKIFWYGADGSVQSRASQMFGEYAMYVDGEYHMTVEDFCQGLALQFFN